MEPKHIETHKPFVSVANMRVKGKADLWHILPTIQARGVIASQLGCQLKRPDCIVGRAVRIRLTAPS